MSNVNPDFVIALLRLDGGTQPRIEINEAVVADYTESIGGSAPFPPLVAFFDGTHYWLADGFHRLLALLRLGLLTWAVEVRTGSNRDAILYSLGANYEHGLRRTDADKLRAVMTMLNDPTWVQWSQAKIAEHCHVSKEYVSRVWNKHKDNNPSNDRLVDTTRTVERGGTTYQQDVAKIGKKVEAAATEQGGTETTIPPVEQPTLTKPATQPKPSKDDPETPTSLNPATMTDFDIEKLVAENADLKARLEDLEERRAEAIRLVDELKADNDSLVRVFEEGGTVDGRLMVALKEASKYREQLRISEASARGNQQERNELIRTINGLKARLKKLENANGGKGPIS